MLSLVWPNGILRKKRLTEREPGFLSLDSPNFIVNLSYSFGETIRRYLF